MRLDVRVPAGYVRVDEPRAMIVARRDIADAVVAAYRAAPADAPTLHGYASRQAAARAFQGRQTAYAIDLPGCSEPVVVRHNRHGGALRALTSDLFFGATRAPTELEIALRLHDLGIPSPMVVAYAVYPTAAALARSDVLTREISDGKDLGAVLRSTAPESTERVQAWNATRQLLGRLAAAGVRHHDLNVKNVLLRRTPDDGAAAYVLDVDRVEFDCSRRDASAGNSARLRRSIDKWRRRQGAAVTDAEIAALRHRATSTP